MVRLSGARGESANVTQVKMARASSAPGSARGPGSLLFRAGPPCCGARNHGPDAMTDSDQARPGAPAATSLLRDGAFLRVWLTGGAAGVLRWLELLAISVYVLETAGSPFLVALMTFLRMAPMFLFVNPGRGAGRPLRSQAPAADRPARARGCGCAADSARHAGAHRALADCGWHLPEWHVLGERIPGAPHHARRDRRRGAPEPRHGARVRRPATRRA